MRTPTRSRPRLAAILLVVTLAVGACSGDDGGGEPTERDVATPSASADGPPPLRTTVTWGKVTGELSRPDRRRLKRSVRTVVDGWLDAAYVGGEYPRRDFHDAFPRFTRGARADARRDAELMTNRSLGARIDGVVATRRRLRIDALVVQRRAVGVTARFLLAYRTTGEVRRKRLVSGRLLLTRADGWRVFGYDVTQGGAR